MQKYSACCVKRCLVYGCEIKEDGGCYCVCRMNDNIISLQSIIDGKTIKDGCCIIYIPDEKHLKEYFSKMSKKEFEDYIHFRYEEAPKLLEKIKKKIEPYMIKQE